MSVSVSASRNSHRLRAFVRVLLQPTNSFTFKVDADKLTLILRIFASSLSCLTALVATATLLLLALLLDMMTDRMTEKRVCGSLRKRNAHARTHTTSLSNGHNTYRYRYYYYVTTYTFLQIEVLSDLTDDKFVPKVFENACSVSKTTATKFCDCGTKKYNITFARVTSH